MKRLLILLALLLSHGAMAAGLGLEFKNITVPQLSQAVLKGILHRGYVLSPAVLAQEERFSVSVNYIDDKQVLPLLEAILTSQGIAIAYSGEAGQRFHGKLDGHSRASWTVGA